MTYNALRTDGDYSDLAPVATVRQRCYFASRNITNSRLCCHISSATDASTFDPILIYYFTAQTTFCSACGTL